MDFRDTQSMSPLNTRDEVMVHLESEIGKRPLNTEQKIQVLRDLMASELGAGSTLFHDCCQDMIAKLRGQIPGTPESTTRVMNVSSFLADSRVLTALMTDDLERVAGQNVAFRVNCIEELGRARHVDILLKQVGRVRHWKEGQALLRTLLYVTAPVQIFGVLEQFIRNQFSNKGWGHFGADIYREESMDGLVNTVIARSDLPMLRWLSGEFRKGSQLMGLHREQFDRYDAQVTAALVACEVRANLSGLIDLKGGEHPGHAPSAAFPVMDLGGGAAGKPFIAPVVGEIPAVATPPHEPTRVLPRSSTGQTPPPDSALSDSTGSLPLPPRGSHAADESSGFVPEDL